MTRTWMVTILILLAVCMSAGCPSPTAPQPLDPEMYPSEWPLPGITALEGSTPTPFPKNVVETYSSEFVFSGQSYSTPGVPLRTSCGICFTNPAGWQAVFDDLVSKCSKEGLSASKYPFPGVKFANTHYWKGGYSTVRLSEISSNVFILEIVSVQDTSPKRK